VEELSLGASLDPLTERVELSEDKVFTQIGENNNNDHQRWILDTRATNHMSGAQSASSEINFGVRGSVKFGDRSVVEIEGRGTILFLDKGGEHRWLTQVYYIPRLRANIVSLGQLEEGGYRIYIELGFLKICDENRRVLT
jgi:hypothetical protein